MTILPEGLSQIKQKTTDESVQKEGNRRITQEGDREDREKFQRVIKEE